MYNSVYANSTIGGSFFVKLAKDQVAFLISALDLSKGAKILDVPCGVGRHSKIFARNGFKVVGIDLSKDCISIAKKKFSHKNAVYKIGDMGKLGRFNGQFDAVVNLFTSFGYFHTDQENKKVLEEMVKTLKPHGKIVINLIDRDWILKIYDPARWNENKGILNFEASKYDKRSKYNESQMAMIDLRGKKPRLLHHHYHRVRLYSKNEMLSLMKSVGLKNIKVYGDFKGHKFKRGESTHPIYIGER